ncbi:MAG: hypothetical protein ABH842_03225 [Candidatus Micrarchaeota archaeon]
MYKKTRKSRQRTKKILSITSSLECDPYSVLHHMEALCNVLRKEEIQLTTLEKMQVVKSIARAKVRAFMVGPSDNYKTFRELDMIGNDLVQML